MLDELKIIHERDAQDALGVAEKQWQQLEHDYIIKSYSGVIDNVVVGGMGGSALAASLSQSWPGLKVPYEVSRNYEIPEYVSEKTLFVASSYSGNTEETLEAIEKAGAKKAQIVVITAGGKLSEIAEAKNYPLAKLPSSFQPRMAALANWKALLTIFDAYGVTNNMAKELTAQSLYLKEQTVKWRPDVATNDNLAKQLALELVGKSVVVYTGPKLAPVGYKWKISINENAKTIAWCNQYPEFNHNEFLGWTSHPLEKPYVVVDLRSKLEHPRNQKRFEVTERLLSGRRPAPQVVIVEGETLLQQLLWTVALGDFVSIYLAILNGLNPTPVDLIEKFKAELN